MEAGAPRAPFSLLSLCEGERIVGLSPFPMLSFPLYLTRERAKVRE